MSLTVKTPVVCASLATSCHAVLTVNSGTKVVGVTGVTVPAGGTSTVPIVLNQAALKEYRAAKSPGKNLKPRPYKVSVAGTYIDPDGPIAFLASPTAVAF